MHTAAFLSHAGIPADDSDATVHGTLEGWHDRIGVVCGNGDRVNTLSDQAVDHFDLAFRGRACWTSVDDLNISELCSSLVGTFCCSFKEADAKGLDHKRNAHVILRHGRGAHQARSNAKACDK